MIRFPPRLKWDLARVRIAQKFFASSRRSAVLHFDLADFPAHNEIPGDASADSSSPVSSRDSQVLAHVRETAAPIIWIGGDTPLRYPRIGHLVREIINLGRTVFIESDGTLLRRRIHEFRPVSRLYLVLPLNGFEAAHDLRAQHRGNFRANIESIRTAKLSGFHICVETKILADTQLSELRELAEFIHKLDIDGWIHTRPHVSVPDQPTEEKLAAARELIPNRNWREFTAHLTTGVKLTASAPHAEITTVGNNSTNHELPIQEESIRAL
jgi:MoaA/NifB/PqqE/SkfB family radical SAM enzyme